MRTRLSRRTRIALVAGITAFLTLVGSGSALALWSTSTTVSSTATAATTGLTQTVQAGDTLKVTYASTLLSAAGAVTIANTGSRAATYSLAILAASPTVTGLPGAVAVSAAPVASVASCTTAATLSSPTTGVLSTTTAVAPTGTVAAGASVIVCVQTAMTASNVPTYADASLQLALQSSLKYGTGTGAWTVSAATVSQKQTVASALLFFTDPSARYNVLNSNVCTSVRSALILTTGICTNDGLGQFRIAATSNGNFTIATATNSTTQPTSPQWALASATSTVAPTNAAAVAAQRWTITKRADGLYRLVNEAYGTCATVTTTSVYSGSGFTIVGATCDDALGSQGFAFTMVSSPIPASPYAITCTGSQYSLAYSWPVNTDYQQETSFEVLVGGVFLESFGAPGNGTNYTAAFHLAPADLPAATWGTGVKALTIKQSISGSAWTTVATGTVNIVSTGAAGIYCQ